MTHVCRTLVSLAIESNPRQEQCATGVKRVPVNVTTARRSRKRLLLLPLLHFEHTWYIPVVYNTTNNKARMHTQLDVQTDDLLENSRANGRGNGYEKTTPPPKKKPRKIYTRYVFLNF